MSPQDLWWNLSTCEKAGCLSELIHAFLTISNITLTTDLHCLAQTLSLLFTLETEVIVTSIRIPVTVNESHGRWDHASHRYLKCILDIWMILQMYGCHLWTCFFWLYQKSLAKTRKSWNLGIASELRHLFEQKLASWCKTMNNIVFNWKKSQISEYFGINWSWSVVSHIQFHIPRYSNYLFW